MIKKIMVASLAVGALALGAPVAHAQHAQFDCGFDTIAQETATGGQDTFTGVAYGYVVAGAAGNAVTIACEVRVDGTTVDSTDPGSGTTVATSQGQVTYTASDTQDVDLCVVWYTQSSGFGGPICGETTTTQIPPQEVIDLLNSVFDLVADMTAGLDPIVCGALQALGAPSVINVFAPTLRMDADDCDLYVDGERFLDFIPYDD